MSVQGADVATYQRLRAAPARPGRGRPAALARGAARASRSARRRRSCRRSMRCSRRGRRARRRGRGGPLAPAMAPLGGAAGAGRGLAAGRGRAAAAAAGLAAARPHEPTERGRARLARRSPSGSSTGSRDETPLAVDRAPDRRRRRDDPPAAARHPAGPAGAPAQAAAGAGRRRRPPGPDRRDRGHGPDGAGRCAAPAGGRSDARRGAQEPAVRARRGASCSSSPTSAAARSLHRAPARAGRDERAASPRRTSGSPGCWRRPISCRRSSSTRRLLGEGGARERFVARLGTAAIEPIEAFLAQALAYERGHPPSLQGFLHWLRADTHRADPRPGPAARRGARADRARRQGAGGAGRGARGHDLRARLQAIACCGSSRTACRSGGIGGKGRDRVSAAGAASARARASCRSSAGCSTSP